MPYRANSMIFLTAGGVLVDDDEDQSVLSMVLAVKVLLHFVYTLAEELTIKLQVLKKKNK